MSWESLGLLIVVLGGMFAVYAVIAVIVGAFLNRNDTHYDFDGDR